MPLAILETQEMPQILMRIWLAATASQAVLMPTALPPSMAQVYCGGGLVANTVGLRGKEMPCLWFLYPQSGELPG